LHDDIGSVGAQCGAKVCESVFFEGYIFLVVETNNVLGSSLSSGDASSANTFAIFNDAANLMAILFDGVSVVFLKARSGHAWSAMAVGQRDILFKAVPELILGVC
jgi:hypothetical protein